MRDIIRADIYAYRYLNYFRLSFLSDDWCRMIIAASLSRLITTTTTSTAIITQDKRLYCRRSRHLIKPAAFIEPIERIIIFLIYYSPGFASISHHISIADDAWAGRTAAVSRHYF